MSNIKKRVEYADFSNFLKSVEEKEQTELEGVSNYRLKPIYLPVLDRKFISKFNPKKTCISLCGNKEFEFDENKLIKNVLKEVEKLKNYHENNSFGIKEHIGEYNIFENIEIDNFMLEHYSFGLDSEEDYYLILWFTPIYLFNNVHKHVYWYGKNHNGEWY